ncbi:hypothetical protein GCM10022237_49180 [Nocardioides ginsengisoli]
MAEDDSRVRLTKGCPTPKGVLLVRREASPQWTVDVGTTSGSGQPSELHRSRERLVRMRAGVQELASQANRRETGIVMSKFHDGTLPCLGMD